MIYYYIAALLYLHQNGSETDVKYIISKQNKGAPYLFYDDIETNYINDIYIWKLKILKGEWGWVFTQNLNFKSVGQLLKKLEY